MEFGGDARHSGGGRARLANGRAGRWTGRERAERDAGTGPWGAHAVRQPRNRADEGGGGAGGGCSCVKAAGALRNGAVTVSEPGDGQ